MGWFSMLLKAINRLTLEIEALTRVIRLKTPGLVTIAIQSEDGEMLQFVLNLPPAGAADVIARELTVAIGTNASVTFNLLGTADVSEGMSGADNDPVTGTLVDIDDAGNRSEPRTFSFVLTDTIPPPTPGEVGLTVTGEV